MYFLLIVRCGLFPLYTGNGAGVEEGSDLGVNVSMLGTVQATGYHAVPVAVQQVLAL
jgi:hypothetical protein